MSGETKYQVWECRIVIPVGSRLPLGSNLPPRRAAIEAVEAVEAFRITRAELHSLAAQTIGQFIAYQQEGLTFLSGDVVESWLTHRKDESKGDRSL